MKIADIMHPGVLSVTPDTSLRTVRDLFDQHGYHHLLVVEGGRLLGILSDRDLLRNISPFIGRALGERQQDLATLERRAHQIMTRKLVTVTPSTELGDAVRTMLDARVHCLPVVNERGSPVGIVSGVDLLAALAGVERVNSKA
jgi:acetoin utilization protein AcuB